MGNDRVEQASRYAVGQIEQGLKENNLNNVLDELDRNLTNGGLSKNELAQVSNNVARNLENRGLLPQVVVEFGTGHFEPLARGSKQIQAHDLDRRIQGGMGEKFPIQGMLMGEMRNRIDGIALAHQDASSWDRDSHPSADEEIGKGISKKDLQEWGKAEQKTFHHRSLSTQMVNEFGSVGEWTKLAGADRLLTKDELDAAIKDTFAFSPEQRNVLSYMRENYGDIRETRSGDSWNKMSYSDMLDYSRNKGVRSDFPLAQVSNTEGQAAPRSVSEAQAEPRQRPDALAEPRQRPDAQARQTADRSLATADAPHKRATESDINVDSETRQAMDVIDRGIREGRLVDAVRSVDRELTSGRLSPDQVHEITTRVGGQLSSNLMMTRAIGQYSQENFQALSGGEKYIQANDLDVQLRNGSLASSPVEGMLVNGLRRQMDAIAPVHDDVINSNSDTSSERARDEIRWGVSKNDLKDWSEAGEKHRNHVENTVSVVRFFGSNDEWTRLSGADGLLDKDEAKAARNDTFTYNADQRAALNYLVDNYSSIKSTRDDGSKMTLSDVLDYGSKMGITSETIRARDEARAEFIRRSELRPPEPRAEEPRRRPDAVEPRVRPDAAQQQSDLQRRVGPADQVSQVQMGNRDTLWALSSAKYGSPEIKAIWEANGMAPRSVPAEGRANQLRDPRTEVGRNYTLPAQQDVSGLSQRYDARANELRAASQDRVGKPEEATPVDLIYGDTLSRLARQKYGRNVPIEALFEANNLQPTFVQKDGQTVVVPPTYFAGKTYILPPESQLQELAARHRAKFFARR